MLEIKNLTKNFGGLAAISDVEMNVNKGELLGLIGPNGAGKTTMFNLITGFSRPTSGKIIFYGSDITGRGVHSIASKGIVRTFQANNLYPDFTVLQSIMAACYLRPKFGFWEAILHLPSSRKKQKIIADSAMEIAKFTGLDGIKDVIAKSLPHKHKRVLGIAIALAAEPKLLLLDEPLSGMNSKEVTEACELIRKVWQNGTTILLIEHNMRAAMALCQRLVVLSFGKKIAEGLPEEIRENEEVIQAYLGASKNVT